MLLIGSVFSTNIGSTQRRTSHSSRLIASNLSHINVETSDGDIRFEEEIQTQRYMRKKMKWN